MAWIEVHQSLPTHRKTLTVADLLDLPPVHVIGYLVAFWLWALDNAPTGELNGISPRMIARAAQWDGDPDQFVSALVKARFLDPVEDGYVIHNWDDYAGRLIEQRQYAVQQKRRHRELYGNKALVQAIRERDKDRCRYCGRVVNWRDRKGPDGATYDYIDPSGPTSLENVVVACRACNAGKGQRTPEQAGYVLLPPPVGYLQKSSQNQVKTQPVSTLTIPNLTVPNRTGELNTHAPDGATAQLQPGEQRKRAKTPGASPESVEAQKVTAAGEDKPRPPFKTKRQQEMFDDFFWPEYPKKRSKGQAEKAWVKVNPNEQLFQEIMTGLRRAKASEDWQRENGRFIPYPATWLNAKGWEDEYTPAPPRKGVSPGAKGDQHPGAAAKDQELDLDKFCWPGTRV